VRGVRRYALVLPIALLALLVAVPATARAQAPELPEGFAAVIAFEPAQPRVGERVRLTITVTHPADRLVSIVEGVRSTPALEVLETPPPLAEPLGTLAVTEFAYVLAPFALGRLELGPLRLQALREDGTAEDFLLALDPLVVPSGLTPQDMELRPLKPQLEVPGAPAAWERWAPYAGGAAAAALVTFALVALVRRRLNRPAPVPARPPATAEDLARRQLDVIRQRGYLEAGDLEAFYGELSLAVRTYIEARYEFPATALTPNELTGRMGTHGLDRWQARLVTGLLGRCEAAVYAHAYPRLDSADHDLTVAYEIVELSRPTSMPDAEPAEVMR
jgi:hypothetical protein